MNNIKIKLQNYLEYNLVHNLQCTLTRLENQLWIKLYYELLECLEDYLQLQIRVSVVREDWEENMKLKGQLL